jgi:hypothetical protein
VLSVALVILPFVFASAVVFPLGNSFLALMVLIMYFIFTVGLWFPVAKYNKVRKNTLYMIGVLAAIFVPVAFAWTQVLPLLHSSAYGIMYLLMHFVIAGGVILAYSHRAALKKIV